MAICDICKLHPKGTMEWFHCTRELKGTGCKGCEHKCKNEAFYIGGMNICSEHMTAFSNRMVQYWKDRELGITLASLE